MAPRVRGRNGPRLLLVDGDAVSPLALAVIWEPDAGVGWLTTVGAAAARGGWVNADEAPPKEALDSPAVKRLASPLAPGLPPERVAELRRAAAAKRP